MMAYTKIPLQELIRIHYGTGLREADRDDNGPYTVYGSNGPVGRHRSTVVDYPTIIIGRKGSVGAVTFAPKGGWPIDTTFYTEIIDHRRLDLRFLFYALAQLRLHTCSITTSIPGLNRDEIYSKRIPVPKLEDQRRIATILDKANAIRRKRQEASQLVKDFLKSTFLEMFGNPLTNSKAWKLAELSSVAEVHRGRFSPRPRNDPKYYGGQYPFIQTGEIARAGGYLRGWRQSLNEEGIKVSRLFSKGTVVIAIVGATIGETAILDFDSYAPDSVVGIEPFSAQGTSEYIEFLLRFWRPVFLAKAPETARANINLETVRPLKVPLAPIEMQMTFSKIYRITFDLSQKLDLHSKELFESVSQHAFRGEL
jgi:type I restriction enzyme, S subunit